MFLMPGNNINQAPQGAAQQNGQMNGGGVIFPMSNGGGMMVPMANNSGGGGRKGGGGGKGIGRVVSSLENLTNHLNNQVALQEQERQNRMMQEQREREARERKEAEERMEKSVQAMAATAISSVREENRKFVESIRMTTPRDGQREQPIFPASGGWQLRRTPLGWMRSTKRKRIACPPAARPAPLAWGKDVDLPPQTGSG